MTQYRLPGLHSCWMLVAIGLSACARQPPQRSEMPSVEVAEPVTRVVTDRDTYPGRFESADMVEIRPRVSGMIDAVLFKDGDMVRRGDPLFRIDTRPFASAVEQSAGQLTAAQSQFVLAAQELERAKALIATNTIAPELLERRQQSAQATAAAVRIARASLRRARLDLGYCMVIAPMSGRISRHLVSAGSLVEAGGANGTLLTTIVSVDPIDFYFDIDERRLLRNTDLVQHELRQTVGGAGSDVLIALLDRHGATLAGPLDFVDNRLDRSTGTLRVRARIRNPDGTLSPGQFGRAQLVSAPGHEALLVPDAALMTQPMGKVLDVVGGHNKLEERAVDIGALFGTLREIKSGLKPRDRVVVSGLQQAQIGDSVNPHATTLDVSGFKQHGEAE